MSEQLKKARKEYIEKRDKEIVASTPDKTYARDVKADKIEAKTERVYQYVQYVDKSLQLKKESDVRDSQQSNYFLWEKEYGPDSCPNAWTSTTPPTLPLPKSSCADTCAFPPRR